MHFDYLFGTVLETLAEFTHIFFFVDDVSYIFGWFQFFSSFPEISNRPFIASRTCTETPHRSTGPTSRPSTSSPASYAARRRGPRPASPPATAWSSRRPTAPTRCRTAPRSGPCSASSGRPGTFRSRPSSSAGSASGRSTRWCRTRSACR